MKVVAVSTPPPGVLVMRIIEGPATVFDVVKLETVKERMLDDVVVFRARTKLPKLTTQSRTCRKDIAVTIMRVGFVRIDVEKC